MAPSAPDSHGITVLFVEDDSGAREEICAIVRLHYPGMHLVVAENGMEGLASFKKIRPELVVTDINLPIVNGIEMAAAIKALCPSTEIIALTAYSNTEYLLQAIEIGINHYILKPIDMKQLFKAMDKLIKTIVADQQIAQQNALIRDLNIELTHKATELELVNQELASFDYTVAHDLRNPMVTITGFSQRLLDMHSSTLDEVSVGYLQVINQEIARLNNLIATLLKFSTCSRKHVEKRWTSLTDIVQEICVNLVAQAPDRRVRFHIAEEVGGYGDPELLRIVLDNLLGNAWKFSAKKTTSRIEFGTITGEDDMVYFVRDNGIGFDQHKLDKLFIPFQRLHNGNDVEGLGIGLATAHRIILRHGGRLWAEGKKGKGATFFFTL